MPKPIKLAEVRRALYEQDLHRFVRDAWAQIDPSTFIDGTHIRIICAYLEAFSAGEVPALLINIPPRHAKSLIVSVLWAGWLWARAPETSFLCTSYAESLAHDHARLFKALITSEWYRKYWPHVELAFGHDKVSHYENERMGKRYSVAINGTMGKGGRFVLFDDPHNVLEAESDEVRDKACRAFDLILSSRISAQPSNPGGFCCIMQRLHERDYAGRLIEKRDDLVHLCLPATFESDHPFRSTGYVKTGPRAWQRAETPITIEEWRTSRDTLLPGDWRETDGDLLWPEMFNEDRLHLMRVHMEGYGEAGQLQQRPVPREGGILKAEWLQFVDKSLIDQKRRIRVRAWDLAGTDRKGSPYTAGVLMSFVRAGTIDGAAVHDCYVEHVVRFRAEPAQVMARIKGQAEIDGRHTYVDIPQDPGQAGKGQVRAYARAMAAYPLHWSPESGSKAQRFESFATQAHAGNVYLVNGPWVQDYVDEITVFPGSQYADQADASSRAYNRLLELGGSVSSGVSSGSY